jgi:hypothetical protein
MAIVSVNELKGRRGTVNEKGQTEYTRKFQVQTDSALIGSLAVRTASGVPRVGDVYTTSLEFDTNSLANSVEAVQDDENARLWEVTVNYGAPSAEEQQTNPNPLLRPAVLTWGFTQASRVIWKDTKRKVVANSAIEYFDPPIEIDDSRPQLTITRNFPSFNAALAIDFQDAINDGPFLGFPKGTVKVAGISASSQTENNFFYWQVSVEFQIRRDGWKLEVLDQGRSERIDGKLKPIWQRDGNGNHIENLPVADPVPLDKAGRELLNPTPDTVKYMEFDVYEEKPFALLQMT